MVKVGTFCIGNFCLCELTESLSWTQVVVFVTSWDENSSATLRILFTPGPWNAPNFLKLKAGSAANAPDAFENMGTLALETWLPQCTSGCENWGIPPTGQLLRIMMINRLRGTTFSKSKSDIMCISNCTKHIISEFNTYYLWQSVIFFRFGPAYTQRVPSSVPISAVVISLGWQIQSVNISF